ncbi:MAG: hypothetical protein K0R57_3942 [Paenibacillaceae bacterium]|jgi:putative ABC transport system permease protein|nr:hypothetical protein [Paenibacillaceae bacterium]
MMLPNSNSKVVAKLTARSMAANRRRNGFMLAAIMLTAWLIASFFSVGLSFYKTYEAQQWKMSGSMAHYFLTEPTEEQLAKLASLPAVKAVGVQSQAGKVSGFPEEGMEEADRLVRNRQLLLTLLQADPSEWELMRLPAVDGFTGHYPEEANEIAAPLWILKQLGIEKPSPGMSLQLEYQAERNGEEVRLQDVFVLSGWYQEYTHLRYGNRGSLFVSEKLARERGLDFLKPSSASIRFHSGGEADLQAARLGEELGGLSDGQQLLSNLPMEVTTSEKVSTGAGYGLLILFVMLSGYLLIYNVMYISVSRDTRFYGLLRTLGMTSRQIRRMVKSQTRRLSLTAIPAGLALAAATSFGVVPLALRGSNLHVGTEVSFHPLIFAGTALFAWMTAWIGSMKPASVAGKVSPVEAVRYTGVQMRSASHVSTGGAKLYRLAWRNIFRVRKRAAIVFLSLFIGLTTFLMVTTLVLSMDMGNLVDEYMDHDFELKSNSPSRSFPRTEELPLTEALAEKIAGLDGVEQVQKLYREIGSLAYDPSVFGKYVDGFAAAFHTDRPSDAELNRSNMFFTNITAVDTGRIKELLKEQGLEVDMERFENGELALLDDHGAGGLVTGQTFKMGLYMSEEMREYGIGGVGDFSSLTSFHHWSPTVLISGTAIKRLTEQPAIEEMGINAEQRKWDAVSAEIRSLISHNGAIVFDSRKDMREEMESAKSAMYILGGGLGLLLALIGILNFINIMLTGVMARRLELAVMESLGMTSRQLRKLLMLEGGGYALVSTVLVSTLGTLATYGVFRLFRKEAAYAVFRFPWLPLAVVIILVGAACVTVPLVAFRQIRHNSIVERLRQAE